MKAANFIDKNWQASIDFLSQGQSVFLCAPKNYGKKYFIQHIKSINTFESYKIITLLNIKDSEELNFQQVLDQFESSLENLENNNQYEFITAIESLIQTNSFLVLIANTFRSCKNVSQIVDALHEVILKHPNGRKKKLTVFLADDYSMYYLDQARASRNESSPWYFFKKILIEPIEETLGIENRLLNFFHNRHLSDEFIRHIIRETGGHQGLILEVLNHFIENWQSINFGTVNEEIESKISKSSILDSLRKELLNLSTENLKYLCSFKSKKLEDTNCNELVQRFRNRGVLVRRSSDGDSYITLIKGRVSNLLFKINNSKAMGQQKKLILCVHGLSGSEETWARFKEFYSKDIPLMEEYDFECYTFPTSMWWNINILKSQNPPINQLADGLKTEIEYRFDKYSEIVLVCHSLGGLVGRKFLLEKYLLEKNENNYVTNSQKIKKIIMYATPHNGASIANVAKYITIRNRQVRQLSKNSDFIQELNDKWMKMGAHDHYAGWYVVGGVDQIVDKNSAELFWGNYRCKTIIDADHFSIIKPKTENSLSYLIFRKVLLED
ncbi:MAG TPA: hypothetical protein VKT28_19345 [Puia sp.]|nr:hypothetical protein [Puia sp.]